uniref:Zinc finger X-linked protein ZXDB n=1 Tax=Cacopsylla melanoneura TaxID=428564 RepID=A0A8D8T1B7_9HEMI
MEEHRNGNNITTVDNILEIKHGTVERNVQQSRRSTDRNIDETRGQVDSRTKNNTNEGVVLKINAAHENEGFVEDLNSLCDVIKVFQCKLCVFKSHAKQSFVHHLKSCHHKKGLLSSEEFALEVGANHVLEPDGKMAPGSWRETIEMEQQQKTSSSGTCELERAGTAESDTATGGPGEMDRAPGGLGESDRKTGGAGETNTATGGAGDPDRLPEGEAPPSEVVEQNENKISRPKVTPIDDIAEFNSWLLDPICDLKPFRCTQSSCSVKLSSQSSLDIHTVCHRPEQGGFKCYQESCSEVFTKWGPCKSHLQDKHDIECDLITCPVPACTYLCSTRSQLGSHLKHHARINKRHACDTCDAVYRTRAMLTRHVTSVHAKKRKQKPEGDRWYTMKQCLLCLRTYSDIKCLKKHIREVHKRLKPFQCAVCGFSTGRKASLQLHVRQHTQEKPYACDKCEFKTGDHNILRKHIQRHMPVKKYQCTFETCSYSCTEPFRLKSHLACKHKPRFLDELSGKLNIVTVPAADEDTQEADNIELEDESINTVTITNGPQENTIFYYTVH